MSARRTKCAAPDQPVRLADLLTVRPGYLRAINLEQHTDHFGNYIPTGRALDVVGRIMRTLNGNTSGHAWSLTGPYGSGKSSFGVFLKALLGPTGHARETADRLLADASADLAADLDRVRVTAGQDRRGFILATTTCQPEPVIASLLRALEHGSRAYWPSRRPVEVSEALARAAADPRPRAVAEAVAAIADRAPVLLLLDEFGKALEYFTTHAAAPTTGTTPSGREAAEADLFVLQEIAEMATGATTHPVLLMTLQHLAFDDYVRTAAITQRREWGKVAGRFEDVPFLETAEQSLRLVAGAVQDRPGEESRGELTARRREWSLGAEERLVSLGLHTRVPGGADTLERSYPLHPVALLALPELCSRLGQHGRTLFTFLASAEKATLGAYLNDTTATLAPGDALPDLRLPWVYDFFAGPGRAMAAAAGQRWTEIETRIREAQGLSAEEIDCLKTVGLLNLIADATGVRASAALVSYALSPAAAEGQPQWRKVLEDLENRGWLTYRKFADEYRLWQGSDVDLRTRVADAREQLRSTGPADLLSTQHPTGPLIAGQHSQRVGMLRYFAPVYLDATSPTLPVLTDTDPADGALVYFLGTPDQADALAARAAQAAGQAADKRPVVLATSHSATTVVDAAIEAASALAVLDQHDVASDRVARRELQDRAADARRRLGTALDAAFRPGTTGVTYRWLAPDGWRDLAGRAGLSRLLSEVCGEAYGASPEIRNEMLGRRELTSQGARARRTLLEAMVEHGASEQLNITGYGPERAMYEALLRHTGLHAPQDPNNSHGSWAFAQPNAGGLGAAWGQLITRVSSGRPVSVADLYAAVKAPPIGLKDGPIPVLLTAWLLHRADDIAIYEDGTYQPALSAELLERLVKAPQRFAVKEFDLAGPRARVLNSVLDAAGLVPSDRITGRNATVLRAAAPLLSQVRSLPAFTRNTRKALSTDAEQVRDALLKAREPDVLLFETLPAACGLPPVPTRRPRDKAARDAAHALVDDYARRLAAALSELNGAFDATLADCASAMSDELTTREPLRELREDLRVRARTLITEVLEPRLRSFLLTAAGADLDDAAWLEAMVLTVTGRPPAAWNDDDLARFHANLHDLASTFRRVEALHIEAAARSNDGFTARRIAVTEPDGTETSEVVWMDHATAETVTALAAEVITQAANQLGPNGPRALLAALAGQALTARNVVGPGQHAADTSTPTITPGPDDVPTRRTKTRRATP